MMNVPTTSPVQAVEGFYVTGGGGGVMQGGMPPNATHPPEVAKLLARNNYIFDVRLGAQSFSSIPDLANHLIAMMSLREILHRSISQRTHRLRLPRIPRANRDAVSGNE